MYFVFIWEQTATCATYSINWLVYNRDEKCLQRGTNWVFKYSGLRFVCKGLMRTTTKGLLEECDQEENLEVTEVANISYSERTL